MKIFQRIKKFWSRWLYTELMADSSIIHFSLDSVDGRSINVNPYVYEYFIRLGRHYGSDTYSQILEDYRERMEVGFKKYHTYLMTHNRRHLPAGPFQDAYEEALDGVAYSIQGMLETGQNHPQYRAYLHMRELFGAAAFIAKLNIEALESAHAKENE